MKRSDRHELFSKIKEACGAYGVKHLAVDLEKPYGTLSNELNPDDKSHKLGLETLVELFDLLGSDLAYEPLDWLVARYGYSLVSMKEEVKADLSGLMHKLHKEVGDVSSAYFKAIDPLSGNGERISDEEREALRKEVREAMAMFQKLHSALD